LLRFPSALVQVVPRTGIAGALTMYAPLSFPAVTRAYAVGR
jgi:hypothetical protein